MKKKIVYISIGIFLVLTLMVNTKNKKYINNNKESNNKSLAIYIEDTNGNYNKSTSFPIKDSGYTLNSERSVCSGNTSISWDNESWGLELGNIDRENTMCYLYFDKS